VITQLAVLLAFVALGAVAIRHKASGTGPARESRCRRAIRFSAPDGALHPRVASST
jgi:hypothetical protein